MIDFFAVAFKNTMAAEGRGYSFDRLDPGGETFWGISRVFNPGWKGWKVIDLAFENGRQLSTIPELPRMVKDFYREYYWNRFQGDNVAELSKSIALELFDTAVNLSVEKAVLFLQEGLNLLNDNQSIYDDIVEDGILGKITISTLNFFLSRRPIRKEEKEKMLLGVMNTLQGMHYINQMRRYPTRERFRGWFLRV